MRRAITAIRRKHTAAPEASTHLQIRAELMSSIAAAIKAAGGTQREAAERCGINQPRLNNLLRGRVSSFSLDALVKIATAIGLRVRVDVDAA